MNEPILHNIRVLDFTWVMAGPYATRLLADYGAEVIKVQPLFPPEEDNAFTRGYYQTWNRNKLGVTLNLSRPEGIELAKKLVAKCDVVLENFTPHVMKNFGLDYENLKKVKPDIIMLSLSVMGQGGDKSYYTGFAHTVHALSGLTGKMALEGFPIGPGFSFSDHIAGLYAVTCLLAALEQRRKTGEGQFIDVSETELVKQLFEEKPSLKILDNIYLCKDGQWCAVTVIGEKERGALERALGMSLPGVSAINGALQTLAEERSAADLMALLQKSGVAAGVVRDAATLVNDPQIKARKFIQKTRDIPFIDAPPVKIEGDVKKYHPAPTQGQDNTYVYGKILGLSKKEIQDFKNNRVI